MELEKRVGPNLCNSWDSYFLRESLEKQDELDPSSIEYKEIFCQVGVDFKTNRPKYKMYKIGVLEYRE
ncbi:MAG: hypothetical protein KKH52_00905 [Nanoarchaeota archaeon]|nr:hypothetical protein [Nanoarchaeota archaeon]MBU1622293.1 hypothetical protein [Nanoarchaeota archaeon]MBU1973935.1 hypothetical protein [Nanoarchaeota archaeon]